MPQVPVHTKESSLYYIQEGYDTGIGPDFLKKKKGIPRPVEQDNDNAEEVVIDAVIVEENVRNTRFTNRRSKKTSSTTTSKNFNAERVATQTKRKLFNNNPADIFPDLYETKPPPSVFDTTSAKIIQGGSLRTWSMEVPEVDHAQVLLRNFDGNPLHAQIDVWDGPDRAPVKLAVYCANTKMNPFSCVIPTPGISKQSIGIKNAGPLEFPIEAVVIADVEAVKAQRAHQHLQSYGQHQYSQQQMQNQHGSMYNSVNPNPIDANLGASKPKPTAGFGLFAESLRSLGDMRKIDGSSPVDFAIKGQKNNEEAFHFEKNVDSIQVLIETSGLACQARIEVTYDRNHNTYSDDEIQQVVELQIEDGKERPFFAVIETPLKCPSTVRIVNLDPYSAFPLSACAEPYTIGEDDGTEEEPSGYNQENDLDIIDASIEEDQEDFDVYSVPDITIPATDADYDFDEDFFFANWTCTQEATANRLLTWFQLI